MSLHEQIRDILLAHRGKGNAIKSPEIANEIGIEPGPSNVNIRNKITETIKMYRLPVAATPPQKGYYYIDNATELKDYIDSLESRILSITDRKTKIYHYYYTQNPDEGEVELVGEIFGPDEEE